MPFFDHDNKEKNELKGEKQIAKDSRTKPNELIENQTRLIKRMSELEVKITKTVLRLQQATSKDDRIFYTKLLKEYEKRRCYYDNINKIYLRRISELNLNSEGDLSKSGGVIGANIPDVDVIENELKEGDKAPTNPLSTTNDEPLSQAAAMILDSIQNNPQESHDAKDKDKEEEEEILSPISISSTSLRLNPAESTAQSDLDIITPTPTTSSRVPVTPSSRTISEEELSRIIKTAVDAIHKMEDFERVVIAQKQVEIVTYPPLPKPRLEMIHKMMQVPGKSVGDVDAILTRQYVPDPSGCRANLQKELTGVISMLMPPPAQMDREPVYLTCGVCSKQ